MTSNYLAKPDSGLYMIVSLQTTYDFDMGSIMFINAVPFESLENHNGNINFNTDQIEYFCFWNDDNVFQAIKESAETQRLWKVNLNDFNNHFGPVPEMHSDESIERNFHIHNELIGLEYSSFTIFDTVDVFTRIDEKEYFGKTKFDIADDNNDDFELPF